MGNEKKDKLVPLMSRIPEDVRDLFSKSIPRGVSLQHVITAAIRMWVTIPHELRKQLIAAESELDIRPNAFLEIVNTLVVDRLADLMPQIAEAVKKTDDAPPMHQRFVLLSPDEQKLLEDFRASVCTQNPLTEPEDNRPAQPADDRAHVAELSQKIRRNRQQRQDREQAQDQKKSAHPRAI